MRRYHAREAIAVPLSVKRDDGFIDDWISAPLAASGELVCIAIGAIGTASLEINNRFMDR